MTDPTPFIADLHIHSRFSRATSRELDLPRLAAAARKKGIAVVGTGDFTHPEWLAELEDQLVPAEPGLFRLRPDLERAVDRQLPASLAGAPVRWMLQVEISTIYKKHDRTRKVHHLVYVPSFAAAERFARQLARIGNIASDGRPILGLDSRDLLEITLELGEGSYLVPAHIWTPWFSALGSKSGFDSIDDCYADLAQHIFAAETGLSSDPPMNWRVSSLDRLTLVSNSDAHSPAKLGREACLFRCQRDFFAMRRALESGEGYDGTLEFFPEEGKYHLDGHRKCGVCLDPHETRGADGRCPACGRPVTVGVMHRVEELADRAPDLRPPRARPFDSIVPLAEVIAELEGVGAQSKRVARQLDGLVRRIGPELHVLLQAPLEQLRRQGSTLLAEAVGRMREGRVIRRAGFDGQYGVIRLFHPRELRERAGTLPFTADPAGAVDDRPRAAVGAEAPRPPARPPTSAGASSAAARLAEGPAADSSPLAALDPDQRAAAMITEGPLLIVAGPGTGKTRTITHRLVHLIASGLATAQQCLAITFTRRAAGEMRERLQALDAATAPVEVLTFHALGLQLLRELASARHPSLPAAAARAELATDEQRQRWLAEKLDISPARARGWLQRISAHRRSARPVEHVDEAEGADPELADVLRVYRWILRRRELIDFDDLLVLPTRALAADEALRARYRQRYRFITVDEVQDIDPLQYSLVRQLVPAGGNLCAIGDPDQAIYSFRGAVGDCFERLGRDFPAAQVVRLGRSYRCSRTLLRAATQVLDRRPGGSSGGEDALQAVLENPERIAIRRAPTARAEAEQVVHTIERLLGGHSFFSLDSGRSSDATGLSSEIAFSDIGVLYRTDAQADLLCEALQRSGLPYRKCSERRLAERPAVRRLLDHLEPTDGRRTLRERVRHTVDAQGIEDPALLPLLEPLLAHCGADEPTFREQLLLGSEVDCWDPRAERISLLTLHAAKGLEFEVVFIVGCELGLLPLCANGEQLAPEQEREERRLLYVGITRARSKAFLLHAARRAWRGPPGPREPSPFLEQIAEELLERGDERRGRRRKDRQLRLL